MASWERWEGSEVAWWEGWNSKEVARWEVPGLNSKVGTQVESDISSFYF